MKKDKLPPVVVAVVALLSIAAIIIFAVPSNNVPEISLPDSSGDGKGTPSDKDSQSTDIALVNNDTVQVVIENLHRADSYVRSVEITDYSPSGSSQTTIDLYAKGDRYRIFQHNEHDDKNFLVNGEEFWIWYENTGSYLYGTLDSADYSQIDTLMRTLSYEQLLEIPTSDIIETEFLDYEGEGCIYAKYKTGRLGYTYSVYVSVETGLLVAAQKHDGDELIYSMISLDTSISTPDDELFTPPNSF